MHTRNLCPKAVVVVEVVLMAALGSNSARADDPNAPPAITQHPASQTVCDGVNVALTVVATGQNLSYQWRKDDEPIDGATGDTLNLDAANPADSGDYDVVVTNPHGQATSNAATLVVDPGPEIVDHPIGEEVCEGAGVTLSVTVANQETTYVDAIGSTGSSGGGSRMRGNYYRVDVATTLTRIEQYLNISTSGALVFFVYEADNLSGPYTLIAEDTVADSGTGTGYYSSNPLAAPLELDKYYIIGAAWPDAHTYYWNYSHPNATTFGVSLNGFAYSYQEPLPTTPPTNSNGSAYMQRLTTSDLALTYQWRKDGGDIGGASGPQYTIDQMSADDAGDYDVVLTNNCGQATSNAATLTLGSGLTITDDPNNETVCLGDPVAFSVQVDGPDPSYQWRRDANDIVGATSETYAITAADPNDAGDYDVVVTNSCDTVTSIAAALIVADAAPTFNPTPPPNNAEKTAAGTYRPALGELTQAVRIPGSGGAEQVVCEGDPASFTGVATGLGLQYQWRKDGVDIADATGDSYTISAVDPNDAGDYDVVVSNPCGSATGSVTSLTVETAISITEQPLGDLICEGDPYILTVVAAGTGLSCQWRQDGEDIPGALSDTYTIDAATLDDTGSYDVVLVNGCGEVTSSAATLTVVSGPIITEQPVGQQLALGDPLTLEVALDFASFPAYEDTVGETGTSATGARLRGNSYAVTQTMTLTRIEQYLGITTSGALVFFVYEADSEQGDYTLILEDAIAESGTGLGFFASRSIEVALEADKYYIIGAAWPGSHTYYWGGAHPQETAFGQSVHGYAASYQSQLPYYPVPSSTNVYRQRLISAELVATYQWRKDGVDILDATAEIYSVPAATWSDGGIYDVVISNDCGLVVSDPAYVDLPVLRTPFDGQPSVELPQRPLDGPPEIIDP